MELVARSEVDAAAIDSNVLRMQLREVSSSRDRLRVIEAWDPSRSNPWWFAPDSAPN